MDNFVEEYLDVESQEWLDFKRDNQEENTMPHCQICPISHECQEAQSYIESEYHEEFYYCVLVRKLNHEMNRYISIGLGDPKGYRPNPPDIRTQTFHAPKALPKGL